MTIVRGNRTIRQLTKIFGDETLPTKVTKNYFYKQFIMIHFYN